jgi:lysozyme family protein
MDKFARCFGFTIDAEGGYTMDAADPGNWTGGSVGHGVLRGTKYGISAAAYPALDIATLTLADAEAIYRRDYWATLQGEALPVPLAMVAFDAAVNAGRMRAVIWLQQAAGVGADGTLGPMSLKALLAGDALALAREALARRMDYVARLQSWAHFGLGWSRRLVALAGALAG